ncbi:hypothetical protein SRABI27_03804 [Pedobacter sp. Bi27]|uniref:hypothetical protein n=1 Tax=unclassified Pedobacter TaxID=2628915 RepID=UPI001E123567|nr:MULTISPECIES: hypothetical protein [unclassified Pedobacter]CAH0125900.1 hypothetical protein SRABI36_00127 [Pedobacter sp. Bi36]CAH0179663.1 hypothetical protein SRABI126_01224 [Pedobacter sp. Bi126]CAH0282001.1 hypothetical protein SRABI27_03804 [Pedobacter sp. Bi27]
MKLIRFYILLIFGTLSFTLKAQQTPKQLNVFQDTLIKISARVIAAQSDAQKIEINGNFVKTLVEALKAPNSFSYPFDSLKNVSVVKSSDQAFRVLSWYVLLEDGTYRYYGAIQMNTKSGPLKLYPLIDQTDNLADPNSITNNQKWFGARYYEIVSVTSGNRLPYYVLLGWKGNTPFTTKKVIDILSFDKDNLTFGAPVFDGKELKGKNRIIFEYAKSNAMTLKTDLKAGMIVFDHLASFNPEMKDTFEYHGSDGTFDGFKIIGGRLKLQEDITLHNDPNSTDELYADPKKNVKPIRKF